MSEDRTRHVLRGPANQHMASFLERYRPSISVAAHDHRLPYLSYILSGGYEERFGKLTYHCSEGTLTVHPAGDRHSNTMFATATREIYFCVQTELQTRLSTVGLLRTRLDVQSPELRQLMLRSISEIANPDALSPFVLEGIIVEALALAQRLSSTQHDSPRWLSRLEEYLRSHIDVEPSLADIEREFGRDGSYLARIFRARRGMSMGDYVRLQRIERASQALACTTQPIGEISTELGFSDQSHFGRVFRRYTGMSPLAFRKAASDGRYHRVNSA